MYIYPLQLVFFFFKSAVVEKHKRKAESQKEAHIQLLYVPFFCFVILFFSLFPPIILHTTVFTTVFVDLAVYPSLFFNKVQALIAREKKIIPHHVLVEDLKNNISGSSGKEFLTSSHFSHRGNLVSHGAITCFLFE
jgi:hypothetical protein